MIPVVVVGAGPVGSVLALELAHHGVPSSLVERSGTVSRHPKMDFVNGRSMELLRRLDLTEEIRTRGVDPEHPFTFIWSRAFDEPPVSVWRYPSVTELREHGAERNDGSQPVEPYQRLQGSLLEEIVRRRAREHPLIDLREGWALVDLDEDADGVDAVLLDAAGTRHLRRARYLVGCDGANSTVRRLAEIPVSQTGPTTRHIDVYFRSTDPVLRRYGRAFLTIAAGGLTLVSRDERDTWTGTFQLLDAAAPVSDPVAAMHERLGVPFAVDEVLNVAEWEGRLAVADAYRRGPVFLAGDAAHQFYPTGGHGANTGVADTVDLGWKLAAVLGGWGGAGLLDSYQAERRPVALFNREMCANLLEVWRRFAQLVADGASAEHLAGFLEQDSYQIDNMGLHFGYRYDTSPIVCAEPGPPPRWHWRAITPTTWPGSAQTIGEVS